MYLFNYVYNITSYISHPTFCYIFDAALPTDVALILLRKRTDTKLTRNIENNLPHTVDSLTNTSKIASTIVDSQWNTDNWKKERENSSAILIKNLKINQL